MVGANTTIRLFEFQETAVVNLIELSTKNHKQGITVKSPTGSGKTIILINFIDEYLNSIDNNTAFVWLCPGKGDLEEQSRNKMLKICPTRTAQTLSDVLANGFNPGSTTFINWEMITKSGNRAITEGDRKSLFDRIAEAHRSNIKFIIIIDEEHQNNTAKAQNIIDALSAEHIIRASATTLKNSRNEFYEINENDVIDSGLITKAISVNEGMKENEEVASDYDSLLRLADEKRKEIAKRYKELNLNIRPLVLIQFPNGQKETIEAVEQKLIEMGYSYENGMVSKWMSEDKKDLPENISENDATPIFLLMKQAISTGWDCPRAKILVKLREGMSEQFEIQTIGRIRRMPEAHHYDDDVLDFCYVYTYDEKWKDGLLKSAEKAYETRKLFLKEKCKDFSILKELRDLDFGSLGEREVLNKLYDYFMTAYSLSNDKNLNKTKLESKGYVFGEFLHASTIQGNFVETKDVINVDANRIVMKRAVNTHEHGIYLLHAVDELKKIVGLSNGSTKAILERLFRKKTISTKKLCSLNTSEFYAFIINNRKKLIEDFKLMTAEATKQTSIKLLAKKTSLFRIPLEELYKYDSGVKRESNFDSNAYKDYTSGFNTTLVRSKCEQLFEQYCEDNKNIDWVYKNGDSGQQYFSIVYIDAVNRQWLFYADYIVKMKDGTVWIIETKGGETNGENQNIDKQIENKFNAFKAYASDKQIKWGFVRYLDNNLYINNTEFVMEMSDEHWVPIKELFK